MEALTERERFESGNIPRDLDDTFKTIDALLAAIHAASLHPRAHQLERRLADVAIESIELQRNFLKGIL